RRGLCGVLDPPGPGRVAAPGGAAPERRPAQDLLEGLRAVRPPRGLRARLGGLPGGGRPGAAAVLGQRARAGGRGRGPRAPGRGGAPLGAEGHLRVTYGTRAENDRFLAALDEVLSHVPASA